MILYTSLYQETRQKDLYYEYFCCVVFSKNIYDVLVGVFFPNPVIIICKGYIAQKMESLYAITVFLLQIREHMDIYMGDIYGRYIYIYIMCLYSFNFL